MGLKGRTLSMGNRKHKIRAFSPFCGHAFLVLPFCCINKLVQPEVSCSRSRAPAGHPGAQRAQLCHLGPCLKSSAAGVGAKPRPNSQGLPYGQASASNVREASLGLDLQRHLPKVSKGGKWKGAESRATASGVCAHLQWLLLVPRSTSFMTWPVTRQGQTRCPPQSS